MRLALSTSFLVLSVAGWAQSPAEALRAEATPIAIADLPATYRAVSLEAGSLNSLFGFAGYVPGRGGAGIELFAAAVGATWVDPDEFEALLDGRVPRIRGYVMAPESLRVAAEAADPARVPIFTPTWLERGQIGLWSPLPKLTRATLSEAFGPIRAAKDASLRTVALSQVKQLATGVLILLGDSDDVFPRVNSTAEAQIRLRPYLKNDSLWTSPAPKGGRILFNVALSGTLFTKLENPAKTLLVWEERPWPNGSRAVAFTDGHAKLLNAEAWAKVWQDEIERRAMTRR